MSRLDALPPDQHAALALLLRQGKSYAEVAELLGIRQIAIHDRAHAALAVLAPQQARLLTAARREEVGDFLLGQEPKGGRREDTRTYLESSVEGREWARAVAVELSALSDRPLTQIPGEPVPYVPQVPEEPVDVAPVPPPAPAAHVPAEVEPEPPPAPLAHDATAPELDVEAPAADAPADAELPFETPATETHRPAPAPAGERAGRPRRRRVQRDRPAVESEWSSVADLGAPARRRSSRRGGAVLLGVIVIVAVVVVIVVTHGSSHSETTTTSESAPTSSHTASSTATASSASSSSSTTSTGTTTTANAASGPKTENRLTLTARGSSSDASAIVEILTEDGKHAFYITAKNLPPSNGFFYAVWLYNSATESLGLGRAPAVGSSGRLEGGLLLPSNASDYHEMLLTKETTTRPTHPGPVVLSGPFSLR